MKIYTLKEIAQICHLSLRTVYNHTSQGHLKILGYKTYRWGKRFAFVSERDFKRYLMSYFFDNTDKKKKDRCRPSKEGDLVIKVRRIVNDSK